jgi:transposase
MDKAIQKSKAIEKAALAYNNNPELSYRQAAQIYGVAPNSVINWCKKKTTLAPDIFVSN